ncbi:non-ribosomal peptide synthetase [Clostridium sp. DJ247]|uniref:non-ribosomal peptide synthetase n=1 Tax=Clostridium sp. DJ247 TaxID=2726188 RepID=UPI001625D31D|nr:non-ribosomal peptide synthetase [Clostridium sp. DJ247]MBC2580387.1 amino acid adenylation domain-containing protein [Clostridium sp. DJ247]
MNTGEIAKVFDTLNVRPVIINGKVYFINSAGEVQNNRKLSKYGKDIVEEYKSKWEKNDYAEKSEYFEKLFYDAPVLSGLPFDYSVGKETTYERETCNFEISREIQILNADYLIGALNIVLYNYTNNEEFIVEFDYLHRGETCFSILNNVFVRTAFSGNEKVDTFSQKVEEAYDFGTKVQGIPLKDIDNRLQESIINIIFMDEQSEYTNVNFATNIHKLYDKKYPLTIVICKNGQEVSGQIIYNKNLFAQETINRFIGHYLNTLRQMFDKSKNSIYELELLSDAEKQTLLYELNKNEEAFQLISIVDLFAKQVKKNHGKTAYIYKNDEVSFKEIDNLSSVIAIELQQKGIGPEIPVGVFLERSPLTAASILGILKAGGAYVPLDLSYPEDYINHIINETELKVIITEEKLESKLPSFIGSLLKINDFYGKSAPEQKIESGSTIENLAFIMYTTGSTGKPKGVAMEQQQFLNRLNWLWNQYPFSDDEVASQRTTVNFIPSLLEMFGALLQGITTVILPDEVVKDPVSLINELEIRKVTRVSVVPSLLKMMLEMEENIASRLKLLKLWFTAGEPLIADLFNEFRSRMGDAILSNDYGSTEVNGVIYFDSRWNNGKLDVVPIGKPISNTSVYILDKRKRLVPQGIQGELHIGGAPVSRGYINRPDLTEENFFKNPFSEDKNSRLYNMGDVVRYRADGMIEVIGRRDFQVKINGKRIDVGGVEKVLREFSKIKESTVIVKEKSAGGNRLVAFFVPVEGETITEEHVRQHFEERLPNYMIPPVIIALDKLPRTINGKLDRMKLSTEIAGEFYNQQIVEDEGNNENNLQFKYIEKKLISITAGIVEKPESEIKIDVEFSKMGIDSIDAVRFIKEINLFFVINISVTSLFDYVSIKSLATYISSLKNVDTKDNVKEGLLVLDASRDVNLDVEARDLAIIGISGRFPGAATVEEFWENLKNGCDLITEVPQTRWKTDKYYSPIPQRGNKSISKWGGFMSGIEQFEPLFFNISPKEAELMDPQQRLCLEECWKAFEDAGYAVEKLSRKSVGVFIGAREGDYFENIQDESIRTDSYKLTGHDAAVLSGRISYVMNLTGPCISVDTACSSSLSAFVLACKSVLAGDCEMALAGGVCVLSNQNLYILSSQAGMLSPTGKCYTFDNRADGFVPGEGVGVVIIKSLKKAIADGDNIYAVIKGAEINQDGSTNGITAPSKESQKNLELKVYNSYGIDPQTIGYVEAHGTGTKLGDPIEIEALTEAFRTFTDKEQYCAIGSVKTNIGHTNASSGIIGLIKAVMCLKNKQFVPSLNFEKVNEHINLKNSPFYVNTKLHDWNIEKENKRRAAISSFGFSGTNAHVILEEAPVLESQSTDDLLPVYPITLSAKTKVSLYESVNKFYTFLKSNKDQSIQDVSFTLTTGRNHFSERLFFSVSSLEELVELLNKVLDRFEEFTHSVKLTDGDLDNKDAKTIIEKLTTKKVNLENFKHDLDMLGSYYKEGYFIDWALLYQNIHCRRVSLPTYSFNTKAYWIKDDNNGKIENKGNKLHPLVSDNVSTLHEQRFKTYLSDKDFFISDHIINSKKILPGACYIEMALAAGELSAEKKVFTLKDNYFLSPLIYGDRETTASITLNPYGKDVHYVISSPETEKELVNAEGKILFEEFKYERVDDLSSIDTIKQKLNGYMDKDKLYKIFTEGGIDYGSGFRSVSELWYGDEEALSCIKLPTELKEFSNDFCLHPSLLDGIFQSVKGFIFEEEKSDNCLYLPFFVGEINVIDSLSDECYAHIFKVKYQEDNESIKKFNITVFNNDKDPILRIQDLVLKKQALPSFKPELIYVSDKDILTDVSKQGEIVSGSYLILDRTEKLLKLIQETEMDKVTPILVTPGETFRKISEYLYEINIENEEDYLNLFKNLNDRNLLPELIIHRLDSYYSDPMSQSVKEMLSSSFFSPFYLSKALLSMKLRKKVNLLNVYHFKADEKGNPAARSFAAFAKTIRLENPNFNYKNVGLKIEMSQVEPESKQLLEVIMAESARLCEEDREIFYEDGNRKIREYAISDFSTNSDEVKIREKGVYLITGGAGGLGLIFAEYLLEKYSAKVILCGRSQLDEAKEEKLKTLKEKGGEVSYFQADIANIVEVKELINSIQDRYQVLNGIIHSAGTIRDSFLFNKTVTEIDDVFSSKILGVVNLDNATINEKLDFFVCFSSISALFGNIGQCDYSYANSFMDFYSEFREELRHKNIRSGKTLSVNWPLWKVGGMKIDEKVSSLDKALGLTPIDRYWGTKAFEEVLNVSSYRVLVLLGQKQDILSKLNKMKYSTIKIENKEINHQFDETEFFGKTSTFLKEILSAESKIDTESIESDTPLEKYGIDSIMIINLTKELEKYFGELSKTLFFEYQTISELTAYFIEDYKVQLLDIFKEKETKEQKVEDGAHPEKVHSVSKSRFWSDVSTSTTGDVKREDIAIIGLAGRYAGSKNLNEFWEKLKVGTDFITEIPSSKWDYRNIHNPSMNKVGKTYSKWGSFIEDVDKFDPMFFNISPREAILMDPNERLFMETAASTFQDAGYSRKKLGKTKTGVFVGVMWGQYQLYGAGRLEDIPGSSFASVANRVSYFYNLNGPSMAVDTMCSSSLTAIHLACMSIAQGECNIALAGGVNLATHPNKYLLIAQGNFSSSDGKCRSFGEGGDGYVPGEGVGTVLLKPLSQAIKDKDNIYGVIKSSSLNHGGKTNGYTVPNPNQQATLIRDAYEKAGINPRTISYIEAHGTGTPLGDPIEITGLKKAFASFTEDKQFCSIGSIKSNIGHLEAAAGIAGITKILLQFKNKQLVPSIHSEKLNSNIKFQDTPFYVQRKLENWVPPQLEENDEMLSCPRRAGISSFGAGGSNAHIIFEEYSNKLIVESNEPELIIVSAMQDDRLKEYLLNLYNFIETNSNITLKEIAFTLQTGRDFYDTRFACKVSSIEELKQKISSFVNNKSQSSDIFYSSCDSKTSVDTQYIEELLAKKNWNELGRLWVSGNDIPWDLLYNNLKPQIVSLPTYPFARESYWINESVETLGVEKQPQIERIHPLVQNNESDFYELKFSSTFSGKEFFFQDHMVNNRALLPGVAGIEMAAVATTISTKSTVYGLKNVFWLKPFIYTLENQSVSITLEPEDDHMNFQIFKMLSNGEKEIYTKGQVFAEAINPSVESAEYIDVNEIMSRCNEVISYDECYRLLEKKDFKYGSAMQVIRDIKYNNDEVISTLKIFEESDVEFDQYLLHPSIMDGALHASFGFLLNDSSRDFLFMPIAIGDIQIYSSPKAECYSYVKKHKESRNEVDDIKKYDIKIINPDGKVAVTISDFVIKKIDRKNRNIGLGQSDEETSIGLYSSEWRALELNRETTLPKVPYKVAIFTNNEQALLPFKGKMDNWDKVVIYKSNAFEKVNNNYFVDTTNKDQLTKLFKTLKDQGSYPKKIIYLLPEESDVNNVSLFMEEFRNILYINQVLIGLHIEHEIEFLLVSYHDKEILPLYSGMSGFNKSLTLECPELKLRNVYCISRRESLADYIWQEMYCAKDKYVDVKYENGCRFVKSMHKLKIEHSKSAISLRENGVYLITGGVGGLGLIFAKYLAEKAKGKIKIVLIGRSQLSEQKAAKLEELESRNVEFIYMQSDVSDYNSVQETVFRIIRTHNRIDGIFHSAGINQDSFVLKKTIEEAAAVLKPKVNGTINLDLCTKELKMDFFVLFSSLAGFIGNIGQSDYAYANCFQDNYAEYRNHLCSEGKRSGKCISINWPLWEDGGMEVDGAAKQLITEKLGLLPLKTENGLQVFEDCLMYEGSQVAVAEGMENVIKRLPFLMQDRFMTKRAEVVENTVTEEEINKLRKYTSDYLKNLVSEEIKLPVIRLNLNDPIEKYGIDSVVILSLTDKLEKDFGKVSKTLFFEYKTLADLTEYFLSKHIDKLVEKSGIKVQEKVAQVAMTQESNKIGEGEIKKSRFFTKQKAEILRDDIAIIGLGGRYPQSKDLEDFWQKLKEGYDFIQEVPSNRWDSNEIYDENKNATGKAYTKWGSFLDDIDKFDPLFFNISPKEAALIDPQERLFLETVHHTLEDGGYSRKNLENRAVGVFVGAMWNHYQLYASNIGEKRPLPTSSFASIANRVSYFYNFSGPSLALDTMCSSSLYAMYLACESLQNGDCDMAIAGGVNLTLHKAKHILLSQGKFAAKDGRCRTFGVGGTGYVPGEGCGAVLLKPLKKAIEDKDHIYGVIKGIAINHGGRTNGYTVPNPQAQTEVIAKAFKRAGVNPRTISYIETHGTGTSLGDPIEITGLENAFNTNEKQFCSIGSIKSNIGHLEAAAGIVGLTKILLQMKYKTYVPSLHSKILNPNIDFTNSPFYVQQTCEEWKTTKIEENGSIKEYPRRASLSAFGAGGSNAHLIIEEYSEPKNTKYDTDNVVVVPISARNRERLLVYVEQLSKFVEGVINNSTDLAQTSYLVSFDKEKVKELLVHDLIELYADILNVDSCEIDAKESFAEYGVDHINLNKWLNSVNDYYGTDIAFNKLMTSNSLVEFANYIINIDKISAYYGKNNKNKVQDIFKVPVEKISLESIAYTLQVGRNNLDERLVIICSSMEELLEKLKSFSKKQSSMDNCFSGSTKSSIETLNLIVEDIEESKIIDSLLENKDLVKLAKYWTIGVDVDWDKLYSKQNAPKKVSIPVYPFEKQRCWIFEDSFDNNWNTVGIAEVKKSYSSMILEKSWRERELVSNYHPNSDGTYVILANKDNLSSVHDLIKHIGLQTVIIVNDKLNLTGNDFAFNYYEKDEGYEIGRFIANGRKIQGIIDISDLGLQVENAPVSLGKLAFYQSCIKNIRIEGFQIIHISANMESCNSVVKSITGAVTGGFVRMLGSEYKRVITKRIDMDFSLSNVEQLGEIIQKELNNIIDSEVVYRNAKRYTPVISEADNSMLKNDFIIDSEKVYVITGGTRGIGAEMAKYIIRKGARKLVLMGIEQLPKKENWSNALNDSSISERTKEKLRFLLSLEESGVSIEVYMGSLTEKENLSSFFGGIRRNLGSIGGVIHCAGLVINRNPSFINKDMDDILSVLEPKVEGVQVLHQVFNQDNLDFFILFSSIAGLIPLVASGVSDYAAGNSYMDYFVRYQNAQGNNYYKSLQWPNWIEVGMGEVKNPYYSKFGLSGLKNHEALNLFEKAVKYSMQDGVIMPCMIKPDVLKACKESILNPKAELDVPSMKVVKIEKPKVAKRKNGENIKQWLVEMFSKELQISVKDLDLNTPFGEFGVDSVIIAELVSKIEEKINDHLEPSILIEYPTINSLSERIDSDYKLDEDIACDEEIISDECIENDEEKEFSPLEIRRDDDFMENKWLNVNTNLDKNNNMSNKVAIIGIACHFPEAKNKEEYWNNLVNGVSCIKEVPSARWDVEKFYSTEYEDGKSISKWGGFIEDIEYFDPDYFNLKHEIAPHIDPLVRQFMEVGIECLRDAGYENKELSNKRIGVFVGSRVSNYSQGIDYAKADTIVGIGQNFIAAHLAHFLNLKGPNLVVDTACSSSLMSVKLACKSLESGESEMAIAGGVDILLDEKPYLMFSKSRAISPDGRCFTFDENANGFVPGEGCGVVLLKSLDKAIEDGDHIYAVIEGAAVNNDGHTMGITTPNPEAQKEVIKMAIENANIPASHVSYIEAHGTGTKIGDPIELKALTNVFRMNTDKNEFCAVGSVKTNIGHLLSAAGIASIIKVALSIYHKKLPPTLNCSNPNPRFDFKNSPFYVNTELRNWIPIGDFRYGGISGFGFGGTNVHMILSDAHHSLVKGVKRKPLGELKLNRKFFWVEKKSERVSENIKHNDNRMTSMLTLKSIDSNED